MPRTGGVNGPLGARRAPRPAAIGVSRVRVVPVRRGQAKRAADQRLERGRTRGDDADVELKAGDGMISVAEHTLFNIVLGVSRHLQPPELDALVESLVWLLGEGNLVDGLDDADGHGANEFC